MELVFVSKLTEEESGPVVGHSSPMSLWTLNTLSNQPEEMSIKSYFTIFYAI